MNKIYGLRNDKENMTLIIADDKATLIIQTAESYEVRELNLEFDLENENEISADKVKTMGFSSNYDGGNESEVYMGFSSNYDGTKISSANKENQPEPLQKALKRIKELERVTCVRIDEKIKPAIDDWSENRLTITIDYLDTVLLKERKKADKYKLY